MIESAIHRVRVAMAELLRERLEMPGTASFPGAINRGTFFIRPTRGSNYVDPKGERARQGQPEVNLTIVLAAPGDLIQDWLDEKCELVLEAFRLDPTLGGRTGTITIHHISEPGLLDATTLAVEVVLDPFTIKELRYA